jgi:hypothetical protein
MGTTSRECAVQVLDALGRSGSEFAILHKADAILDGGPLSDLDVVVDASPRETIERLAPELRRDGLHVIARWRYDITAASVFVSNDDATQGAQLDLLHDPAGIGKYGLRSEVLLANRVYRGRWPQLDPADEILYRVRKRQVKGDWEGLLHLSLERNFDSPDLQHRVETLFGRAARPAVLAALRGENPPHPTLTKLERKVRTLPRYFTRVHHPIGFWAELRDAVDAVDVADALATRFGRILDRARSGRRPRGAGGAPWFAREVAPIRWRAGLFVSVGRDGAPPGLDLRLDTGDLDGAARAIVAAMTVQRAAVAR